MLTLGVDGPDTTFHDDALIIKLLNIFVNTALLVPVNATPPNDILTIVDLSVVYVNTLLPKKKIKILLVHLPRDIETTFHIYCLLSTSHGLVSFQTHPPVTAIPDVPNQKVSSPLFSFSCPCHSHCTKESFQYSFGSPSERDHRKVLYIYSALFSNKSCNKFFFPDTGIFPLFFFFQRLKNL